MFTRSDDTPVPRARHVPPAEDAGATGSVGERVIASAGLILLRYAVVGVMSLGGAIVLVRLVGPAAWATYTIAYFLTVNFDQLLGNRLLGLVVHGAEKYEPQLLRSTAALLQVIGGAGALACFGTGLLLDGATALPHLEQALIATGVCVYTYSLKLTQTVLLERELDYRWSVAAEIVDQVSFYAVAVPLVLSGHGVDGLLLGIALRGVLPFALVYARVRAPVVGRWNASDTRRLLGYAGPSLAVGTSLTVEGLISYALLSDHPSQVAFLALATTIVSYAAVAQFVTQRIGFTGLALLRRSGNDLALGIDRAERAALVTAILMVAPIAASSPLWLPPLFGAVWRDAAGPMVLLGVAYATNAAINLLTGALLTLQRPRAALSGHLLMLGIYAPLAAWGRSISLLLGIPVAYAISRLLGLVVLRWSVTREAALRGGLSAVTLAACAILVTWLVEHATNRGSTGVELSALAIGGVVWGLLVYRNRSWLGSAVAGLRRVVKRGLAMS